MNYKIAALGNEEEVFPFRQIGIDVFVPLEGNALMKQVAKLIKEGYALFFVSEGCIESTPALLTAYDKHPEVAMIPIPGLEENGSWGLDRIDNMVERALGQNIL